ncbi:LacI family DNA-binding transcriptional regulator [Listeria costaricensis]|uniref:LacI family DNA-binding transcriptional regulator n=1 Tax=Listeria costaricensis TaxID=2026604 RepID=UPI000C0705A3|nr:LacI family DNA-binding transcriptional regulator [Listeria costaricensis]
MISINEIAAMAGVSKSTVSRYLNGGSISQKTEAKIRKIVEETGYIPNQFARSLKAKETKMIGVIIPRLDSQAMAETLRGIDKVLRQAEYQMVITNTEQEIEREIESLYTLAKQKVAGIILAATLITEKHLKAMAEIEVPIVVVGQHCDSQVSVVYDDYQVGRLLGEYIFEQGHRNVAYVGVSEADHAVGVERKRGVTDRAADFSDVELSLFTTDFSSNEAIKVGQTILKKQRPTAIIAATDNIGLGILKACYLEGIRVPEDVSLISVGGYGITELVTPSLTTIKLNFDLAGKLAAQAVTGQIAEKQQYVVPFQLLERESVDKIK